MQMCVFASMCACICDETMCACMRCMYDACMCACMGAMYLCGEWMHVGMYVCVHACIYVIMYIYFQKVYIVASAANGGEWRRQAATGGDRHGHSSCEVHTS